MFKRRDDTQPLSKSTGTTERVTSVLGAGIAVNGNLSGTGCLRIEGAFEGDIALRGLLVIGEAGRVTCQQMRANVVIVAGAVRGDITAEKLEIRSTGRVWGNVVTAAFSTEEGAFLRGQIRMEDQVDIGVVATTGDGAIPEGEGAGEAEAPAPEAQAPED